MIILSILIILIILLLGYIYIRYTGLGIGVELGFPKPMPKPMPKPLTYVYSGYTEEQDADNCISNKTNKCTNQNCKQGDGYCFCIFKCVDSQENVKARLYLDCSPAIDSFNQEHLNEVCQTFGKTTTAVPLN